MQINCYCALHYSLLLSHTGTLLFLGQYKPCTGCTIHTTSVNQSINQSTWHL